MPLAPGLRRGVDHALGVNIGEINLRLIGMILTRVVGMCIF